TDGQLANKVRSPARRGRNRTLGTRTSSGSGTSQIHWGKAAMTTSKATGLGNKHTEVGTANETSTIRDLRDWLAVVERVGQLKQVDDADYDLELGAIAHLNNRRGAPAALLFDRIKGYPPGFRILTGASNNPARLGITLRLGPNLSTADLVRALRGKPTAWTAAA